MASTRHTSAYAYAARTLLLLTMSTSVFGQGQIVGKGCFSSSEPLENHGSYPYQSNGHCQQTCVNASAPVLGLTGGSDCWCGSEIPAESTRVSDSLCSIACDGYPSNICGGQGYWTVYLTGLTDNVPYYGGSSGDKKSPDSKTNTPSSTTSTPPSVITSVGPGKTVIKTVPANPADASNSHSSGGGSTNTVAIAAGVVVAVVVISAVASATYFYLRHRRRMQTEEEHKRTQIVDFIRNGERKPPQSGYSTTSDSRLDPEFGNKRNSHGSIADNEDFSRKILRVANPDRG